MECGYLPVVELLSLAFKFCNPAGVLPKLNVVTVNHSLGTFLCGVTPVTCTLGGARLWSILLTLGDLINLGADS